MAVSELRRISEIYKKARALGKGDQVRDKWIEALSSSTVEKFREAGIVLQVKSGLLTDDVYLVPDESYLGRLDGVDRGCVYTADELHLLLGIVGSPDELRMIHEFKKAFGGVLMDIPPEELEWLGGSADSEEEDSKDAGVRIGRLEVDRAETLEETRFTLRVLDSSRLSRVRLALGKLSSRIASCNRCGLCRSRIRVVVGEGCPSSIVFVGEGPGRQEDATGRPFVGKAGKFLDRLLSSIGLRREEVYITNVVKCRPVGPDGGDRTPTEEEVKACGVYLKQQLLLIEPELVVALGSTALNYFIPGGAVHEYRGRFVRQGSFVLFATYHPAAAFYKPELREAIEEDFERLGRAIVR